MAGLSDTLENDILNAIFNNTAFTGPATLFLSLHTADPGETGADEASGGSYARQEVTFGAAASGQVSNDGVVTFTDLAAGTYTHVGVWDASTDGEFLAGGGLAAAKTVDAGDDIEFAVGEIDITLD